MLVSDHSNFSIPFYFLFFMFKKGMDRSNGEKVYKCIMTNTSAIWQQAAHITYQLSSLTAQQERYKKCLRVFWKKRQEKNGPLAEKWQDRKCKRTRQENKRVDRKEESNGSPEVPDRGVTSHIPDSLGGPQSVYNCLQDTSDSSDAPIPGIESNNTGSLHLSTECFWKQIDIYPKQTEQ